VIELAGNAALARDLAAGGVFVPGCKLALAEECDLVVCGAQHRLSLAARVVYLDAQRGAGLELIGFSTAMREQLAELVAGGPPPAPAEDDLALPTLCNVELSGDEDPDPAAGRRAGDDADAVPVAHRDDDDYRTLPVPVGAPGVPPGPPEPEAPEAAEGAEADLAVPVEQVADDQHTAPVWTRSRASLPVETERPPDEPAAPGVARRPWASDLGQSDPAFSITGAEADAAFFDAAELADPPAPADPPEPIPDPAPEPGVEAAEAGDAAGHAPRHVHERLRGLTLAAQIKLATSGELAERIVLERLYGKNVWEALLRNPRLTPPEVARIARYGALPRVLLEIILGNATWLQVPEVRRALLSNPRLGTDQVLKVLRLTPKHELRLAAIQTAYPHAVRQAAKQLLRE
jgi:hypothetical protein